MANLFPRTTGLPMPVWVGPRGHARHDVPIKASMTPGDRVPIDNAAVLAVRPAPRVIDGRLAADDERAAFAWIASNGAILVAWSNGDLDTAQLVQTLRPLPA